MSRDYRARVPLRAHPRRRPLRSTAYTTGRRAPVDASRVPPRARRLRSARPRQRVPGRTARRYQRLRVRRGGRRAAASPCDPRSRAPASSRVRDLVRWPLDPSDGWRKGFLAGIFDAEGSCDGCEALRIANTDPTIVGWTVACLAALRLPGRRRRTANPERDARWSASAAAPGAAALLPHHRSRDHAQAPHRWPGDQDRRDAARGRRSSRSGWRCGSTTSRPAPGDFIADGVVSHNCFARPTHEYLDLNAGEDFEQRDRRQGQRARGAAGRARAAVVEGRDGGAGHEHRPVPVGRGPLQADARDLGGAARRGATRARS